MNPESMLMLLLLGALALLQALSWHKIRRIHLATYRLLEDSASGRREAESLFAQLQALMALERILGLAEPLPPMRGWAGSPDFLLEVAREALGRKPQVLVECSSGVSTVVSARCMQLNGSGHVYSLEHEPEFAAKTRKLLARYGLTEWATVLDAPLQTTHTTTPWYAEQALPADMGRIEMLVVDGPPTPVAPLARAPAWPRLRGRMAKRCVVLVDDADRADETEMVRRWRALEPRLKETRLAAEKGLVLLELEP